jgi:hypothetical protein
MGASTPAPSGPLPLPVTERARHRRLREQGSTERGDLHAILAAGVTWHLGVVVDGYPMAAVWGDPEPDPVLPPEIPLPPHIAARARRPLG